MSLTRALLGIAIIMVAILISIPISSGLRSLGVPVNP